MMCDDERCNSSTYLDIMKALIRVLAVETESDETIRAMIFGLKKAILVTWETLLSKITPRFWMCWTEDSVDNQGEA